MTYYLTAYYDGQIIEHTAAASAIRLHMSYPIGTYVHHYGTNKRGSWRKVVDVMGKPMWWLMQPHEIPNWVSLLELLNQGKQ